MMPFQRVRCNSTVSRCRVSFRTCSKHVVLRVYYQSDDVGRTVGYGVWSLFCVAERSSTIHAENEEA